MNPLPGGAVVKTVNVMFLGGAKRVSLAERFIAAGLPRGIAVQVFSYELDREAPIQAVGTVVPGRPWKDPDLYRHLREVVLERNIHIVIPNVDPAVQVAARLAGLEPGLFVPVSSLGTCELFFDKVAANAWFLANGIPVPVFDGSFPAIAKPRFGSASQGILMLDGEEAWAAFGRERDPDAYLVQKFIHGVEFTVDLFVSRRQGVLAAVPRIRLAVVGGEVTKSRTVRDEEIIELATATARKLEFFGPINIQFIRDGASGRLYLMEINPRLGGGVILSIEAGADMTAMVLDEYLGREHDCGNAWREGRIMMRTFREVFADADNR